MQVPVDQRPFDGLLTYDSFRTYQNANKVPDLIKVAILDYLNDDRLIFHCLLLSFEVLEEANQVIPPELRSLAGMARGGAGSFRSRGELDDSSISCY